MNRNPTSADIFFFYSPETKPIQVLSPLMNSSELYRVHEPTKCFYTIRCSRVFPSFNFALAGQYTNHHYPVMNLSGVNLYIKSQSPNDNFFEFILLESTITLPEVVIKTEKKDVRRFGTETNISQRQLLSLPSNQPQSARLYKDGATIESEWGWHDVSWWSKQ